MKIVVCLLTHHQGSCFSWEFKSLLDVCMWVFSVPTSGWTDWYISQDLLLLNGTSNMLLTLAQSYGALIAYVVIYGFCDGAWATVNNIQALM